MLYDNTNTSYIAGFQMGNFSGPQNQLGEKRDEN